MSRVITLNVWHRHIKCELAKVDSWQAKEDGWRAKEGVYYNKTRVSVSCLHAFTAR